MVDEVVQEAEQTAPVVPQNDDQKYLQGVLEKFNTNPDSPELSVAERTLMRKIAESQRNINEKVQKINEINKEAQNLIQQVVHLQGQSQGFLDSLLALRPTSEG